MVTGLRERKKQELRDQLSLTALRLARERGLANVRAEDIVDAVGVSRRTFNNYFATKEDAIADRHVQRVRRVTEILRERPAGESLWEALTEAMMEPFRGWGDAPQPREALQTLDLLLREPSLQGAIARGSQTAQEELTRAIADRTGTDPERDLYPRLVAAAALTAQALALDLWVRADPPVALLPLLTGAFEQLRGGLGTPLQQR
jgi:AcrR family transcriptional regulator